VNKIGTFNSAVTFQVSGLPAGATLRTAPAASATSATFSVNVPVTVVPGTYALIITGTSGSLTHTASAGLVVTSADFSLSLSPASLSAVQGGATANYTITVNKIGTFNSSVSFQVAGLPAGATLKTVPAASAGTSTFSVNVPLTVAPGSYGLTISGMSGTLTHTTPGALVVTAAKLFSIAATPATMAGAQGSSVRYTLAVSSAKGFTSPIKLGVTGLPAGATAFFSPATVTGSGNVTMAISIAATTPKGTSNLTVNGVSGALGASSIVTLTVR